MGNRDVRCPKVVKDAREREAPGRSLTSEDEDVEPLLDLCEPPAGSLGGRAEARSGELGPHRSPGGTGSEKLALCEGNTVSPNECVQRGSLR